MIKKALIFAKNHLDVILTASSCIGVGTTAYFAGRGAVRTDKDLRVELFKQNFDKGEESWDVLSFKDKAKIVCKNHYPTLISGGLTIASIILLETRHVKTEKNLVAAAIFSETMLEKYEMKIKERGYDDISEQIRREVIGEVSEGLCDDIHASVGSDGAKMLCYDPYTKTFYRASQVDLLLAEIDINKTLMNGGGTSLYDFLSRFTKRINRTLIDPEDVGWYMVDNYDWQSNLTGYHCSLIPEIEYVEGRYAVVTYFTHKPFSVDGDYIWS